MRRTITLLLLLATLAACTSSGSSGSSGSPGSSAAVGSAGSSGSASGSSVPSGSSGSSSSAGGQPQLYVSIGDSYAAGYQPTAPRQGSTTRNGFAYQVVTDAKAKGYDLSLVNFGCSGATTTSVIKTPGCDQRLLGPGATPYPGKTQAAAAEAFLRAHRGQVALVTVSIGGNDVTACGASANAISCLSQALTVAKANLATLLSGLRAAAGPSVRIVGTTYPDVLLGNYLSKDAAVKALASLSVVAFKSLINPALAAGYAAVQGSFVDVTAATGAYTPLTQTTTLAPYGTVPVPVAKICQLTYYCQFADIHPRTDGYAIIAKLVVGTLPTR